MNSSSCFSSSFFMAVAKSHAESTIRPPGGLLPLQHSEIGNRHSITSSAREIIAWGTMFPRDAASGGLVSL
jgi:hypothetical protein